MPIPLGVLAVAGASAGGGAAFDWLETTVLGTSTASVTFSNLNTYTAYKHLQIRMVVRDDIASNNNANLRVRFNSVTTANYAVHDLNGTGATVTSNPQTSQTSMELRDFVPGSTTTASNFGAAVIDILDFSSTVKNKTIRALHGAVNSGETDVLLSSGFLNSTNAVTSIQLLAPTFFVSGSRFSLYGIK